MSRKLPQEICFLHASVIATHHVGTPGQGVGTHHKFSIDRSTVHWYITVLPHVYCAVVQTVRYSADGVSRVKSGVP